MGHVPFKGENSLPPYATATEDSPCRGRSRIGFADSDEDHATEQVNPSAISINLAFECRRTYP
jgi:hypothetical protein